MIESHLNWNTEKPKFEDVEGKQFFVIDSDDLMCSNLQTMDYELYGLWVERNNVFLGIGILSTDDSVCEYTKDDNDCFHPGCDKRIWIGFSVEAWQVCPYCTRPVITEPEVKTLYGIAPEIELVDSYSYRLTWSNLKNHQQIQVTMPSKQMLIDLWNDGYFATKMKGG